MSVNTVLVAALLLAACVYAAPCDPDKDLKGYYLACKEDGTRDMIWYWDDRECDSTGLSTPARVEGLSCSIDCAAGEFLPFGGEECHTCEAGTFSIGGGARFEHFDAWPRESNVIFRSWCARPAGYEEQPGDENCDGWRLSSYYMDSGDLSNVHSVYSVLVVSFVLSENDGYLRFSYSLDSEKGSDGLWIQVDNDPDRELPNTAEFKEVTLHFNAGLHFVSWVYYKDEAGSYGEDMAKLDNIEIYGLRLSDSECTSCSPGYFSNTPGADQCQPCDWNTFSSEFGGTECQACPATEYSLRGQKECVERTVPCEDDDYEDLYTECHMTDDGKWRREKEAAWVVPDICLHDGSVTLPASETDLTCAVCKPGYHTLDAAGNCEQCEVGYAASGESECTMCEKGTAAVPEIYFDEWDEWAPEFSTGCTGDDCATEGWELFSNHINSGAHQGQRVDVWFQLNVDIEEFGGAVEFSYKLDGGTRYSFLQFLIDGYYGGLFKQREDDWVTERFELEAGHHELVWNFHRLDNANEYPEAKASIQSVVVFGQVGGGAGSCTDCPAGHYQPEDEASLCLPCPAGSINNGTKNIDCEQCSGNSVAFTTGQTQCQECGHATMPNADHSDCIVEDCIFAHGGAKYNLAPLSGEHTVRGYRNNSMFTVSFCDRLEDKCGETFPYICEERTLTSVHGTDIHFQYDSGTYLALHEPADPQYTFELRYTHGSLEDCFGGEQRQTIVRYKCNLVSSKSTMGPIREESDGCKNVFVVESPYACRMCERGDYDAKEGPCNDGYRTVTFTKKATANCMHDPQPPVKEECADVELSWAPVIIISLIVVVVVSLLIFVALYTFRKKQQLEHKYSQLVSGSGDGMHVEMADVADA